jgi:hypothetical protein
MRPLLTPIACRFPSREPSSRPVSTIARAATIEEDLPRETKFLLHYDQFRNRVEAIVDMPDRTIDLLFHFLHQHGGQLSKRAREQEFAQLTDAEAATAEDAYKTAFANETGEK